MSNTSDRRAAIRGTAPASMTNRHANFKAEISHTTYYNKINVSIETLKILTSEISKNYHNSKDLCLFYGYVCCTSYSL